LWMGPEFAANSGPLLPILAVSTAGALAGQYNSSSLLFGISKHGPYARGLLVEAMVSVAGMAAVIPRYGILAAALVSSGCMLLNRGLYTPWLVCRALDFPLLDYLRSIYLRPTLTGAPILILAYAGKLKWIPGNTWPELIAGAGSIAC